MEDPEHELHVDTSMPLASGVVSFRSDGDSFATPTAIGGSRTGSRPPTAASSPYAAGSAHRFVTVGPASSPPSPEAIARLKPGATNPKLSPSPGTQNDIDGRGAPRRQRGSHPGGAGSSPSASELGLDGLNVQVADPEVSGLSEAEARAALVDCCGFLDKDIVELPPFPPGVPSEDAQYGAFTEDLFMLRRMFVEEKMDVEMVSKDCGQTPLQRAAFDGRMDAVKLLLEEAGANVDTVNDTGFTAAMNAVFEGHLDILRFLVERHNASIVVSDSLGWSMVHHAVNQHRIHILKYLIDKGANLDAANHMSRTPLMEAVVVCERDNVAITMLLKAGANIEITNRHGVTAAEMARAKGRDDLASLIESGPLLAMLEAEAKEADGEAGEDVGDDGTSAGDGPTCIE